jgi:hypothetical protein
MSLSLWSATVSVARQALRQSKLGLSLAVGALASFAATPSADAALIYGVTPNNTLFSFDSSTPGTLLNGYAISGLQPNESVLGIDFRPLNNVLYALGSTGRLYTLNLNTGSATLASTLSADGTDATSPFVQLNGTEFGIDFNPTVDRLRIVTNTRQNLRVNVDSGATITDADINPSGANLMGAGYLNPFVGAASTTLFTIDATADTLNIQNPPNNGTQVTVGALGANVGAVGGLDIDIQNNAYAALTPTGNSITNFYTVNTTTGAATLVGQINGGMIVTDIAAFLPEPGSAALLGLGTLVMLRRRSK